MPSLAETEIGKLPYTTSEGVLQSGSEVELLIHPDDFQVVPHPDGKSVVASREFRGDETILVIRLPSGATLRCRQHSFSLLDPGTKVTLVTGTAATFVAFKKFVSRA